MIDPRLEDEAAGWFLSHQSGEMAPSDRAAFEDWMAGDPDAPLAYRYAERMWGIAGTLGDDAEIAASRSFNRGRYRPRFAVRRWSLGALAACVALAVMIVPEPLIGFVDVQLAPVRGGGQVLSTGANRRTSATLSDGTIVTLDGDTRLRVLEMGARRRVELLAGHAFFRVAKDPLHPFLVTAMNKTVHAIGTAFDVRVEPDAVAVTLIEGKVRVDETRGLLRAPIATDMTPGRKLVATNDQVWMMTPVDTTEATSWLADRLTYWPGTVGKIVADVNADATRKIVFLGPIDQDQRLVGVFERGDVDTLATVLEMKNIAHVVGRSGDRIEMMRTTP